MLKRWLLFFLCCAPPALSIDLEGLVPIGPCRSVQHQADRLQIECADGSHLQLDWLATDLVRLRGAYRNSLDTIDQSHAIAKRDWKPVGATYVETAEYVETRSSQLTVHIQKNPLLVEYRDPQGRVINRDHYPLMGDPEHKQQGKLFDPTAGSMLVATKDLGYDEHFYGLGEKAHHLDRRRGHFTMWTSDTPRYVEGTDPIYQSIPFYIGLENGLAYGVFYDNSYRSHFDFGQSQQEWTGYATEGGELDCYFFAGPGMKRVVSRYTELTGRAYVPPRWALGHQASRWSYYPAKLVVQVADAYRKHNLPLDVMTLDIDYMQGYRIFTWDAVRFPNPAEFVKGLAERGLHTVAIIDPGIKYLPNSRGASVDPAADQSANYYVYEQARDRDFLVKRKSGQAMVTTVWPGETVFADYTRADVRKWWGGLSKGLLDYGIEGIWNDMNEPADFTDNGAYGGTNQRDSIFDDEGRHTTHAKNRNLMALLECEATFNGLRELKPNKRPYVITRAAYAGIQRFSTMWTGDAPSTWNNLEIHPAMLASLGLSGETFVGADVGGFMKRGNGEMLTRAYQLAFLTPFCRNHKTREDYDQEPWRFGPLYEDIIRKYLQLRYRLMPYLYAGITEAQRTGIPFLRPLVLEYQNDPNCEVIDDELLAGPDLLVAPISQPGQEHRYVYLPQGEWYDFYTHQKYTGGKSFRVAAPLETVPLFVRAGALIPTVEPENTIAASDGKPIQFLAFPDSHGRAEGDLYEDDGVSEDYLHGGYSLRRYALQAGQLHETRSSGTYKSQRPAPQLAK